MNSDVLRAIFGLLADCRGAGLCCVSWYAAYLLTPDSAVWLGPKSAQAARVLPKMYPGVWRGSVFDLAAAGNIEPVMNFQVTPGPKSAKHLLEIACERRDYDLLRWAHGRVSPRAFDKAVGRHLDIIAVNDFGCSLSHCMRGAALAGDALLLWQLLATKDRAARYLDAKLLELAAEMPVETVRVALSAGLVRGLIETSLVKRGSVAVLEFLRAHGCVAVRVGIGCLVKYYARGEHDRVLWYCNNVAVPDQFAGATMNQIHSAMAKIAGAIYGLPDQFIIESGHPVGIVIEVAVMRRSMRLLMWLVDNGVTTAQICQVWGALFPTSTTNWIVDPYLRGQIEQHGPVKYDTKQEFRDTCAAIGCDAAAGGACADTQAFFDRCDVFDEFGRWDLIISPRFCAVTIEVGGRTQYGASV